ncbi:hypothetical protein BCR42DRAFT_450753 [Absidia repens]|uniref:Uncharacterized protein n=1 Tax=Absidia repens TaxID=90262 RepID=A0A1X2IHT0_9FUNG|nr:hypothetical protein BCR42DRAFT_450753 [Absidia repens]
MSRECRYICQRAANAIISEVGSYRVSTDALYGINQFLDEFLVQLLVDCQSLDLSRIKASIFNLLPSTLGKNAIVEAELEVKTFTATETIDYTMYEKMRTLGQQQQQPQHQQSAFPTKKCLSLLRDKCFEFCTLADKDDQQSWVPQKECDDVIISPIVAIYVTTVLEHMAEYILTAVAMTAETEDTDYVRIKELFLALVDDIQVGVVFQAMDLRDKMERRSFAHGYLPRTSTLPSPTPIGKHQIQYSTSFMKRSGSSSRGLAFDELDLRYNDEDDTTSLSRPSALGLHTPFSNYSALSDSVPHPIYPVANNTHHTSKKAYKVFKHDRHESKPPSSELASFSVYDPDAPTMNFEDLIRSGNTMRVSLTPNRLKSIETKDQMVDDPAPSKFSWKRRSSSAPRQSTGSRSQTPSPTNLPQSQHSALVKPGSNLDNYAVAQKGRRRNTKTKSRNINTRPEQSHDTSEPHLSDTSSLSSHSSSSKLFEKSLPTPTSSTSSKKSKKRPPVPSDMKLPSSPSIASSMKSTSTKASTDAISLTSATSSSSSTSSASLSSTSSLLGLTTSATPSKSSTTLKPTLSPTPTLRRSSLSNRKSRESIRRKREHDNNQMNTSSADDNSALSSSKQQQSTMEPDSFECYADTKPERPSSYVAKRASAAGPSQQPTPYENHAMKNSTEIDTACTPKESAISPRPLSTAGSVGNAVKQLDEMMKQQSSFPPGGSYSPDEQRRQRKTTTSLAPSLPNINSKADTLDTTTATRTTIRSRQLSQVSQENATFRKSMVLDKVLQFERAHTMDENDMTYRRASSYIPRRERFMYLQRDPNTLERPKTTIFTTHSSSDIATATSQPIVRPGTSAAIAAAAARFSAGVSMAIQTDTTKVTNASITTNNNSTTSSFKALTADQVGNTEAECGSFGSDNSQQDNCSEHGVVVGDEEWFLPEDEWEDTQEQEHAVVEWLLGESC